MHYDLLNKWTSLVRDESELKNLVHLLNAVPLTWVTWVEKQVRFRKERGLEVRSPLDYRISLLWNGMIAVQEGKYICDVLENVFRRCFYLHCEKNEITLRSVIHTIPMKQSDESIACSSIEELLPVLSFYQLTETIARNWKTISCNGYRFRGFRDIFWPVQKLRDVNLFRSEMKGLRQYRNIIAHSKALLKTEDLFAISNIASRWLQPTEVVLSHRVSDYRSYRPRFLEQVFAGSDAK